MSKQYTELPGTAALAYSEALDQVLKREHTALGTGLSFIRTVIKGNPYWYLLQKIGGRKPRKYYLGSETPDLQAAIDRQKALWAQGKEDAIALEKAISMAIAAGCMDITHRAYKVLSAVSQSGLFRAGGVLVGSYAFVAHGNMLGVEWQRDTTITQDIDLAASDHAMIAVPADSQPIREVILDAEHGLLEVPLLDPASPSTSFKIRGGDFRVDLLTPQQGKPGGARYVRAIQSHAQPMVFLDYLLEDTQKAVLLHKDGVLVNIPSPARFALHKLIVAERRPPTEATKAGKDFQQAAQLIACLLDQRPGDLWLALDAAYEYRGKAFGKSLLRGLRRLEAGDDREALLVYWRRLEESR